MCLSSACDKITIQRHCLKKKKNLHACPPAPSRRMAELPGWQQLKLRFRQVCGLRRSPGGGQPRPAGTCGRGSPMPANVSRAQSRPGLQRVYLLSPFCFVIPLGLFLLFHFGIQISEQPWSLPKVLCQDLPEMRSRLAAVICVPSPSPPTPPTLRPGATAGEKQTQTITRVPPTLGQGNISQRVPECPALLITDSSICPLPIVSLTLWQPKFIHRN